MTYFDKKEEVIEVQLTPYGKHLLSKGKFKPVFYEFFDDDILYDADNTGISEEQNDAEDRIRNTPRLKTQVVFSDRTKDHKRMYQEIRNKDLEAGTLAPPVLPERGYFLSAPMGESSIGSEFYPSWKMTTQQGEISGSTVTHFSSSALTTLRIPQLNITPISYKSYIQTGVYSDEEGASIPRGGTISGDVRKYSVTSDMFPDGTYVEASGEGLLFTLEEENSPFEKENFEIEVFLVKENENHKQELIPLSFKKKDSSIKDGFLLDDDEINKNKESIGEPTTINVEYYFDIEVDNEIQETTVQKRQKNTLYSNKVTKEDGPFGDKC